MKVLVVSFIGVLIAGSAFASPERYDGHWWLQLSKDQQQEFISGADDCVRYDLKRPEVFHGSYSGWSGAITVWYQSHPAALADKVMFVSHRALSPEAGWKPVRGEAYPEKHGYFDSSYYWQADRNRAFFVEGYLDCRVSYFHDVLRHPVDDYVQQLDDWFGYDSQSNVSPVRRAYQKKHEGQKIGTVLDRILRSERNVSAADIPKQ